MILSTGSMLLSLSLMTVDIVLLLIVDVVSVFAVLGVPVRFTHSNISETVSLLAFG